MRGVAGGTNAVGRSFRDIEPQLKRRSGMDGIIYLVGLIVVVMAILSVLGLR
jgi:hypothetical protein